jgi:hypothetical protein
MGSSVKAVAVDMWTGVVLLLQLLLVVFAGHAQEQISCSSCMVHADAADGAQRHC